MQEQVTYREAREWSVSLLTQAGIEDALSDTYLFMEAFLGMNRGRFLMDSRNVVPSEALEAFRGAVLRRSRREPLQHITGVQEFCGFSFEVNEDVLIPRQDTELLVRLASEMLKDNRKARVLDLCTGSGCIGISLKRQFPEIAMTLSDLSAPALAVARRNAQRARVETAFCQGDLFLPVSGVFEMIVSNPPYIATAEIETLEEEVRLHDPVLALDGAEDGLLFYRRLAREAGSYLTEGGLILMEIGYDQGKTAAALFEAAGWKNIEVFQDLSGLDRVLKAQKG